MILLHLEKEKLSRDQTIFVLTLSLGGIGSAKGHDSSRNQTMKMYEDAFVSSSSSESSLTNFSASIDIISCNSHADEEEVEDFPNQADIVFASTGARANWYKIEGEEISDSDDELAQECKTNLKLKVSYMD